MCEAIFGGGRSAPQTVAAPLIAATDRGESTQTADIEARLRRRRQGAAADILTSPVGLPATPKLGQTA